MRNISKIKQTEAISGDLNRSPPPDSIPKLPAVPRYCQFTWGFVVRRGSFQSKKKRLWTGQTLEKVYSDWVGGGSLHIGWLLDIGGGGWRIGSWNTGTGRPRNGSLGGPLPRSVYAGAGVAGGRDAVAGVLRGQGHDRTGRTGYSCCVQGRRAGRPPR